FFFSSRRRHTRFSRDWSSDVCSSDLILFFVKKSPHKCRLFDYHYFDYSRNLTVTPDFTFLPKSFASQLVRRIQPCDAVLEIADRSEERRVGKESRCRW